MVRLFRKYFLGGVSDKREASWFIFFTLTWILLYAVWQESKGIAMTQTWAFLMIAHPASMAGVLGVHGQHFYEMVRQRTTATEKQPDE